MSLALEVRRQIIHLLLCLTYAAVHNPVTLCFELIVYDNMRRYQCSFIKDLGVQAVFPHTMRKPCIFSFLVLSSTIYAFSLSLTRKTGQSLTALSRRDNNGNGGTLITNENDRFYNVNISLGGTVFTVELDTGRYA